jgi:hypothetical protein
MGSGIYWLVGAACIAAFGVCLRFALQMLIERNIRSASAWFFWSFLPLLVVAIILVAKGDPTMSEITRNIILGLVGAIMGASAAIWCGYVAFGPSAIAQTTMKTPPANDPNNQPQVTISGGDNIVSVGQMGGITARIVTINPLWLLN